MNPVLHASVVAVLAPARVDGHAAVDLSFATMLVPQKGSPVAIACLPRAADRHVATTVGARA